jgi:hypothetical protein
MFWNLRLFIVLLPTDFVLFSAIFREVIHTEHFKLLLGLHLHHTCLSNVFYNFLKLRFQFVQYLGRLMLRICFSKFLYYIKYVIPVDSENCLNCLI